MKEKIKKLYKNPMLFIFIIILIFYTPIAIYSPGESRNRGIVTAVGIDKIEDEYEISLLTFIPTVNQSFEEQKSIISAKGKSVAEAVYKAQIAMGRDVGLFHAKTTIVNQKLLEEDVSTHLDYLSRVASLPENTVFVGTNKSAKELLRLSQKSKSNLGLKLEQIVGYNAQNIYLTETSLEAFYEGYYNQTKASIIGYLCVEEDSENSEASVEKASISDDRGSSMSGSTSSNNQNQKNNNNLINCGKSILIKNGKMVEVLSVEQLNAINLLNPKSINQILRVKDIEKDNRLLNMNFMIKDKQVSIKTSFENGVPVLNAKLLLKVNLVEVEGDDNDTKISTELLDLSPQIKSKIDQKVKKDFSNAIGILKKNSADIIDVNRKFFLANRREYMSFIRANDGAENFIKDVVFRLNIIVEAD